MRSSILFALLLAASVPAAAQSPLGGSRSEVRLPPEQMACPVHLSADRHAGIVYREVDRKQIPNADGLVLHFTDTHNLKVVSADVTVYGYSGGVIAKPFTASSTKEISEEFHLSGSAERPLVSQAIGTAKILSITTVELTRVTFSDGTVWERSAPGECRIAPSPFVLVK